MNKNQELVSKMFSQNYSAYYIHNNTGLPIKEVYHYIQKCEDVRRKHKATIAAQRAKDAAA